MNHIMDTLPKFREIIEELEIIKKLWLTKVELSIRVKMQEWLL